MLSAVVIMVIGLAISGATLWLSKRQKYLNSSIEPVVDRARRRGQIQDLVEAGHVSTEGKSALKLILRTASALGAVLFILGIALLVKAAF